MAHTLNRQTALISIALPFLLMTNGCEHRKLIDKGRSQKREIEHLQTERDRLQAKKTPTGKDLRTDLTSAITEVETNEALLRKIDAELAVASKRLEEMNKAFVIYRAQHPMPTP